MKLSKLISIMAFVVCSLFNLSAHAEQKDPININKNARHAAMKFNNFAYIFLGPGLNPKQNHTEINTGDFKFTAVGIDFHQKEKVIETAKQLVADGAQIIELCGGFGPLWIAKVSEAIHQQVPVGSVAYGPEARKPLVDLLSDI